MSEIIYFDTSAADKIMAAGGKVMGFSVVRFD
jgi:hypothetical protein